MTLSKKQQIEINNTILSAINLCKCILSERSSFSKEKNLFTNLTYIPKEKLKANELSIDISGNFINKYYSPITPFYCIYGGKNRDRYDITLSFSFSPITLTSIFTVYFSYNKDTFIFKSLNTPFNETIADKLLKNISPNFKIIKDTIISILDNRIDNNFTYKNGKNWFKSFKYI